MLTQAHRTNRSTTEHRADVAPHGGLIRCFCPSGCFANHLWLRFLGRNLFHSRLLHRRRALLCGNCSNHSLFGSNLPHSHLLGHRLPRGSPLRSCSAFAFNQECNSVFGVSQPRGGATSSAPRCPSFWIDIFWRLWPANVVSGFACTPGSTRLALHVDIN